MIISPDFTDVRPDIVSSRTPKQMLSVERDGTQTLVKINNSSLGLISACPRKAYLTLSRGLRSKSESPALVYGTAMHKALEVFYSFPRNSRSLPHRFKEHSELMAHGAAAPESHFLYDAVAAFVNAAAPLRALPDSDKHSVANGIWVLRQYFETYLLDPYVTWEDPSGPVTERFCEAPLFEDERLRIIFFGTIDVILKNEANGTVLPADHKTFSQTGSDFYARVKPNPQYSGYIWLAQEVLGLRTSEFMVNGVQKKPRPVTARGTGPNFVRQITSRSSEDLAEFKMTVEEFVRSYLFMSERNRFPLGNVNECASYGSCTYLDVCSAPSNIRESIIENKFITEGKPNACVI